MNESHWPNRKPGATEDRTYHYVEGRKYVTEGEGENRRMVEVEEPTLEEETNVHVGWAGVISLAIVCATVVAIVWIIWS